MFLVPDRPKKEPAVKVSDSLGWFGGFEAFGGGGRLMMDGGGVVSRSDLAWFIDAVQKALMVAPEEIAKPVLLSIVKPGGGVTWSIQPSDCLSCPIACCW